MSFYRYALAPVLAGVAANTHAVDGVGIGQAFPILELTLWVIVAALPVFTIYRLSRSEDAARRNRQQTWALGIWLVIVIAPYAYRLAGKAYAAHLCSTEARTTVFVSPERWREVQAQSGASELRRPILLESRHVERLTLGVWAQTHRLIDPATKTELMTARAFFATRISRPRDCGGNEAYWSSRERFGRTSTIKANP